jgi:hypothetical protein
LVPPPRSPYCGAHWRRSGFPLAGSWSRSFCDIDGFDFSAPASHLSCMPCRPEPCIPTRATKVPAGRDWIPRNQARRLPLDRPARGHGDHAATPPGKTGENRRSRAGQPGRWVPCRLVETEGCWEWFLRLPGVRQTAISSIPLECDDDADAIEKAKQLVDGHDLSPEACRLTPQCVGQSR